MRPGLSECARATSARESRFRIDAPIVPARAARVIALDAGAAAVVRRVAAGGPWANARFLACGAPSPGQAVDGADIPLRPIDGTSPTAPLSEEVLGSDVVVLVATEDAGRSYAAAIGRECGARGIMTAGVVLGFGYEADDAVAALRPYARVLLPTADESDVTDLLTALRV